MGVLYKLLGLIFIIIYYLLTIHAGILDEYYTLVVSFHSCDYSILNSNCGPWDGTVRAVQSSVRIDLWVREDKLFFTAYKDKDHF